MPFKRTHCDCGAPATTFHADAYVCEDCKQAVTEAHDSLNRYLTRQRNPDSKYLEPYRVMMVEEGA